MVAARRVATLCLLPSGGGGGPPPAVRTMMMMAGMVLSLVQVSGSARPRVVSQGAVFVGVRNVTSTGLAVDVYAGIPYAEAATGARRFAEPSAYEARGVLDASAFGPECPQLDTEGSVVGDEASCLTVNVYVPAASSWRNESKKKAVMVWIHGGGLTEGAASLYDLKELAARGDVVAVSVQYRLNVLGFLNVVGAANPGLADQVLALRWVRDRVSDFGGDPARVTVFGQSAGGSSVLWLAADPAAQGLFQRAIAESPWSQGRSLGSLAKSEAGLVWDDCYCAVVDCALHPDRLLDELRAVNATDLVSLCGRSVAVVDRPLVDRLCVGNSDDDDDVFDPDVELVVGSNTDEARLFLIDDEFNSTAATLDTYWLEERAFFKDTYFPIDLGLRGAWWTDACADAAADALIEEVAAAYDVDANQWNAVDFATDFEFTALVELAVARSGGAAKRYLFEQPVLADTSFPLGTCHCAEIPYVLGFGQEAYWHDDTSDERAVQRFFDAPSPDMRRVHRAVQDLWLDFANGRQTPLVASHPGRDFPYSLLRNGSVAAVAADVPVHTRAGRHLAHSLYCDRDSWRQTILAASECASSGDIGPEGPLQAQLILRQRT